MSARTARAAGLCLFAALLAACSQGDQPPLAPLDSAFRARVDTACSEFLALRQQHPFPLKHFDPHDPDPALLPAVAAYFTTYDRSELVVTRLTGLGEPAQSAHEWDQLLSVLRQAAANGKVQIRTAAASDVDAFKHSVDEAEDLHEQLVSLGEALGFGDDSTCTRYFS